jgi:UDP-2,3-diacylglucosamine pyrophosphatase LpxH
VSAARPFRTLFVSDVHLGTKGCQADRLLDFLRHHEADTIYLVGDIVDGWQLRSSWYWPQAHNDVVQKFLRQARKGARVVYVPGNHDEFLRDYYGVHFGGVEVVEHALHVAADGRRYLVVHGDHFDLVVTQARWLALLGSKAYDVAVAVNRLFNAPRRRLGFPYWSLSQWAKLKVKNAVNYIGEFERTLADAATTLPTAWSAATSITPRFATISASATSIAATGSRAVPPWSSIVTDASKSCIGSTKCASAARSPPPPLPIAGRGSEIAA